ncbi:hypothetical protein K491DRAFT_778116 [Lophiostoma macrostomum CBS 122681]|uniref:Uncharacterized protein n=1 Tax=Lophiostoma macrostomum CBS 122681 TaxID=1314788 RepID=A0A6A6T920_9PLEO|nr:hypothetical protein K491DRAFT_778116 [Lophiostoma macrostomum CBS 122681]
MSTCPNPGGPRRCSNCIRLQEIDPNFTPTAPAHGAAQYRQCPHPEVDKMYAKMREATRVGQEWKRILVDLDIFKLLEGGETITPVSSQTSSQQSSIGSQAIDSMPSQPSSQQSFMDSQAIDPMPSQTSSQQSFMNSQAIDPMPSQTSSQQSFMDSQAIDPMLSQSSSQQLFMGSQEIDPTPSSTQKSGATLPWRTIAETAFDEFLDNISDGTLSDIVDDEPDDDMQGQHLDKDSRLAGKAAVSSRQNPKIVCEIDSEDEVDELPSSSTESSPTRAYLADIFAEMSAMNCNLSDSDEEPQTLSTKRKTTQRSPSPAPGPSRKRTRVATAVPAKNPYERRYKPSPRARQASSAYSLRGTSLSSDLLIPSTSPRDKPSHSRSASTQTDFGPPNDGSGSPGSGSTASHVTTSSLCRTPDLSFSPITTCFNSPTLTAGSSAKSCKSPETSPNLISGSSAKPCKSPETSPNLASGSSAKPCKSPETSPYFGNLWAGKLGWGFPFRPCVSRYSEG